jgi:hypothetical protein
MIAEQTMAPALMGAGQASDLCGCTARPKSEADQAAKDIANIMYYEADNLKSEWAGFWQELRRAFAKSPTRPT